MIHVVSSQMKISSLDCDSIFSRFHTHAIASDCLDVVKVDMISSSRVESDNQKVNFKTEMKICTECNHCYIIFTAILAE